LAKAPPHSRSAPCRTVSRSFPAIPRQSFPSIPLGSKADTQIWEPQTETGTQTQTHSCRAPVLFSKDRERESKLGRPEEERRQEIHLKVHQSLILLKRLCILSNISHNPFHLPPPQYEEAPKT
jgi:hypothetical protein